MTVNHCFCNGEMNELLQWGFRLCHACNECLFVWAIQSRVESSFRVFSNPKYRPCEYPVHEYLDSPIGRPLTANVYSCLLGEHSKQKMSQIVEKVQKGGGAAPKSKKKVYISNVDSLSYFSQIQITEIWPWFLWYYGTHIGKIYATFGIYMPYIWIK